MADSKASKPKAKPMTKTEIYNKLAEKTGLSKKDVGTFFEELESLIQQELKKKDKGVFVLPGLIKMTRKKKPGRKAGMRKNPFTGEMQMSEAKPAHNVVQVRALKKLKDMV